jgi:hypothetical protein
MASISQLKIPNPSICSCHRLTNWQPPVPGCLDIEHHQTTMTLFCPLPSLEKCRVVPPSATLEQRMEMSPPTQTTASRARKPALVSSPHLHDPVGRNHIKIDPPMHEFEPPLSAALASPSAVRRATTPIR